MPQTEIAYILLSLAPPYQDRPLGFHSWPSTFKIIYFMYNLKYVYFFFKTLKDNTFNSYQIFIITKLMYFLCLTFLLIKISKVCIVSYMHGLGLTIG